MSVNARNDTDSRFAKPPVGVNFRIFDILLTGCTRSGHGGVGCTGVWYRVVGWVWYPGGMGTGYGASSSGTPWYGSGCPPDSGFTVFCRILAVLPCFCRILAVLPGFLAVFGPLYRVFGCIRATVPGFGCIRASVPGFGYCGTGSGYCGTVAPVLATVAPVLATVTPVLATRPGLSLRRFTRTADSCSLRLMVRS